MAQGQGTEEELAVLRRLEADPGCWADVVRTATGRSNAVATDVSVATLSGGAGNPTSAGLFRVTARVAGEERGGQLTMVLKRLRSPGGGGDPMDTPGHPLYWRRELEAYRSGLLDDLPSRIVAPLSFGAQEFPDATGWLWLEDMGQVGRSSWTDADYHAAASHLAAFHAAYLTGRVIPDLPWLNRDFARAWLAGVMPMVRPTLERAARGEAGFSALAPGHDGPVAPLVRLLLDPEASLVALEAMPQVLCHLDANPDNLLLRRCADGSTDLVALDWQLVGTGPVGEDVAQLLSGVASSQTAGSADLVDSVLLGYWEQLRTAGAPTSLRDVRRGYHLAAAVRQVSFAFVLLSLDLDAAAVSGDRAAAEVIGEFVERTARGHLPGLVDRAGHLLDDRG